AEPRSGTAGWWAAACAAAGRASSRLSAARRVPTAERGERRAVRDLSTDMDVPPEGLAGWWTARGPGKARGGGPEEELGVLWRGPGASRAIRRGKGDVMRPTCRLHDIIGFYARRFPWGRDRRRPMDYPCGILAGLVPNPAELSESGYHVVQSMD